MHSPKWSAALSSRDPSSGFSSQAIGRPIIKRSEASRVRRAAINSSPPPSCLSVIEIYTRDVPQRRWRKRSHGENRILSASSPMTTMMNITPMT